MKQELEVRNLKKNQAEILDIENILIIVKQYIKWNEM